MRPTKALLFLLAVALAHAARDTLADDKWKYRAELPDSRPVPKTVELFENRPEDLMDEPTYKGTRRRYAQVRYGSENSRRVIVVVDELGNGEYDFYADFDRNRGINANERIEGAGRERQVELDSEILHELTARQFPRRVALRLGVTGDRLSIATVGCIVGTVMVLDPTTGSPAEVAAQRIDGDANGLFADSRDRLRVDLNRDGRFDPISEQFTWLPVMTLAGRRYGVKADREGESLSLSEITGSGQLQVTVAKLPQSAKITAFEAMVFSDDGAAWSLKEANKPQEVPVGRYALGSVTMTIEAGEREPWHFVFSRNGHVKAEDWKSISAGGNIALEAVGQTNLVLNCDQGDVQPGGVIAVSPRLHTQDGLLINLSSRGRQIGSSDDHRTHNHCEVRLVSKLGETLSSARSGFA